MLTRLNYAIVLKTNFLMFNNLRFKTQITWLLASLILMTVILLTASYWVRITDYAETQIERQIYFAKNVLNQNLSSQEQILTISSSVLAADFGFKQVVATRDEKTIESALSNHRKRIQADVMMLVDTKGQLINVNAKHLFSSQALEQSLANLPLKDVHAQILSIEEKVFQVIVVPVKAPRVIAYAVIGFEFDHQTLLKLKDLVSLHLTFVHDDKLLESSFNDTELKALSLIEQPTQTLSLLLTNADYFHQTIPFGEANDVSVILSASLVEIHQDLNRLISATLIIALLVLLIAIAFSRLLSRRVSNPLNILMGLTKKIGSGKLKVPALTKKLSVEFTELYHGFSVMGAAIEHREREITYQAEHDLLTGLYNRHAMLDQIDTLLKSERQLALITFNIKGFKSLNDTIGISNGDKILKEVAKRLLHYVNDLVPYYADDASLARVNADQFLIALPCEEGEPTHELVQSLQSKLDQPYFIDDLDINLQLYFGLANSIEHGCDAEHLIRRVTIAVSAADKEQVHIRYYQEGEDEAYLYKLRLIEELKIALDQEEGPLFLNYQPKMNLKTGKVDKLEALIRWINKEGDFVNPEVFVGLAEKAGLIVILTRWVILRVIEQVAQWNKLGYHFKVSINLSAQDIQDEHFVSYLLDCVGKHDVLVTQITLELTERDLAENESLVIKRLTHLKSLGFEISVDDYGIGQSSLAKLKNLPVDELKIDKAFILRLNESQEDQYIVASTISLGHKLDLRVVAEGVENEESMKLLNGFNCDYVQGYYLSRPLDAEKLITWYDTL